MNIRDYDPAAGQAFQGDVAIIPIPTGITIATDDEIKPAAGRLILQHGEVTGHHHSISIDPKPGRARAFRPETPTAVADPFAGASPELAKRLRSQARAERKTGIARMYRDLGAAQSMAAVGLLARTDLCVGFLLVEGGPVVVTHQEHDGIRLPAGRYYIGRQVESVGAEERQVQD